MDRRLVSPTFSNPPDAYAQRYMQDLVRSLNDLVTQIRAPGLERNTTITFTDPTTSDAGLEPGTLWDNGGFAGLAGRDPINPALQGLQFDTTAAITPVESQLAWDDVAGTLAIGMEGGAVIQQVGQEVYMRVGNATASVIADGTAVGFAGVNGNTLIEVAPYLADGAANSLFFVGVATEDLAVTGQGFITVYGRVGGIDTTGTSVSETWAVGDLLWAHPTIAGGLTNVKPTAPNNVISVAAVLAVDATDGVIFVRPTIEQQQYYGEFTRTTSQTVAAADTAYYVSWSSTKITNGVVIDSVNTTRIVVPESGLYNVNCALQFTSSVGSKRDIYGFFRKNGTLVPDSRRAQTIDINGGFVALVLAEFFSFDAGDYIEIGFGASDTSVDLAPISATTDFPSAPAATLSVYQLQQ